MKLQEKFTFLEKQRSAVLATIFNNFETSSGILPAAPKTGNFIINQATLSLIHYRVLEMTFTFARTRLKNYGLEGWLHLDYAETCDLIKQYLGAGYNSEIFVASEKSFSKNAEDA
ncbi:MAG: class II fructose-bisphosphate aldolase [Balneolaceae bacterium]|nr:class II fructose-bisphosphate aldolase [Balneolaceae bacterium]